MTGAARGCAVILWTCLPGPAVQAGTTAPQIRAEHAWARETPPGATVGAAYFRVVNPGPADRLVSAATPIADHVELHLSKVEHGMMQMRELKDVAVPAHGTVVFSPGTRHAMLVGLKQPLHAGDHVALTLVFEHAGTVTLDVPVRALGDPERD